MNISDFTASEVFAPVQIPVCGQSSPVCGHHQVGEVH